MSWLSWLLLLFVLVLLSSPFLIALLLRRALAPLQFTIHPRGYFTYARISLLLAANPLFALFLRIGKCKCRVRPANRKALFLVLEGLEATLLLDGNN